MVSILNFYKKCIKIYFINVDNVVFVFTDDMTMQALTLDIRTRNSLLKVMEFIKSFSHTYTFADFKQNVLPEQIENDTLFFYLLNAFT